MQVNSALYALPDAQGMVVALVCSRTLYADWTMVTCSMSLGQSILMQCMPDWLQFGLCSLQVAGVDLSA